MASFKREKKLEDFLQVGEPLVNTLAAKGVWKKLAANCSAIECMVILKNEKSRKKLCVIVRGKGGEFANFTEALGEIVFLSDRVGPSDLMGVAFPALMRSIVVSHAKNMAHNWKRMAKLFRCSEIFFVSDDGSVEQMAWLDALKAKHI